MKKKILFMLSNMNIGGTEKAFLNMLSFMSKDEFDVTILLLEKKGGFLKYLPDWVDVKVLKEYKEIDPLIMDSPQSLIKRFLKGKKILQAFQIAAYHLKFKILGDRSSYYKYVQRECIIKNSYDVAIAYSGPMDFISIFILDRVQAKEKIQWIHFDVSKFYFNHKLAQNNYLRFDKVIVVSTKAAEELIKIIPNIREKVEVVPNLISSEMCYEYAKEFEAYPQKTNKIILTVGILTEEKGQEIIPDIVQILLNNGYENFKWYVVGDGKERENIEKKIIEQNIEEYIEMIGVTENPYPYYKDADIYVQTSLHEGFCITLAEAKVFQLPIITTDVAGAYEQILSEKDGYIVERSAEKMARQIERVLEMMK